MDADFDAEVDAEDDAEVDVTSNAAIEALHINDHGDDDVFWPSRRYGACQLA